MTAGRTITLFLLGLFLPMSLCVGQERARGGAAQEPKAARRQAGKSGQVSAAAGEGAAQGNQAGVRALQRLSRMTPEERERALAALPPQRREEILQKFREFQNLPSTARARLTPEVERLQSLPPQRQSQVRRSLQQFNALPEDRKATVREELNRLSTMPDEERRARMNSEEFRNRYSPAEQQMIGNVSEVVSAPKD